MGTTNTRSTTVKSTTTTTKTCTSDCLTSATVSQVLLFGCWKTSMEVSTMSQDQMVEYLQMVLQDNSSTTDLVEDGSAVAFLQQNGQQLSTILDKTSEKRREEIEILILAAFTQLQTLDLAGVDLSVMVEYAGILGDMQNIFLQDVSTASTYDIARVCCRSLKLIIELSSKSIIETPQPPTTTTETTTTTTTTTTIKTTTTTKTTRITTTTTTTTITTTTTSTTTISTTSTTSTKTTK